MKRRCIALALLLFGLASSAGAKQRVGIDEKLGEVVPLGDLVFNDEDGNAISLESLADRPLALSLVFFRCSGICTPLLNELAKATDNSNVVAGKDFRLVSVSFDTRDTPALAKAKKANQLQRMKSNRPDADGWRFLTGNKENIDKLTEAVGFNYMASKDGDAFNHAGVVVFMAKDGKICRYLHGSRFNPMDIQMSVEDASAGQPRPFIRTLQKLCFAYDPVGRTYVLQVNRIILAITLAFAFLFGLFLLLRPKRRAALAGSDAVAAAAVHQGSES